MTVYNLNLGIGWASSGVEYAQAYRAKVFQRLGIRSKFVFTDFIGYENILHLTRNIGIADDQVIWLYSFFTDQTLRPTRTTLEDIQRTFIGDWVQTERTKDFILLEDKRQDVFLRAYFVKDSERFVHRVEYVSKGCLIRKDFFTDRRLFTEYYLPKDGQAQLYLRRFFHSDGSLAYEELIEGQISRFRIGQHWCDSKEELVAYFMQSLHLTEKDVVLLDRATGIGQAVFSQVKPAKLGVVVHAEHFSESSMTDDRILWNNFYEYQFTNADKVDVFITSTQTQADLLRQQFARYTSHTPVIVTLPVGSIDRLQRPVSRKPYSIVTASRLAMEKHIDWLVRAVVLARESIPVTLDIYGAGAEEGKIRENIEAGNAQAYIRLCGHQDLTEVYQKYEVYLSGSRSEGFGLTLLEAVGSGLAMIGFDVRYGNQTFIRHGQNGYLIPPFDAADEEVIVTALAEKIVELFMREDIESMHEMSYDIASAFLTPIVEQQWKSWLEEVGHD